MEKKGLFGYSQGSRLATIEKNHIEYNKSLFYVQTNLFAKKNLIGTVTCQGDTIFHLGSTTDHFGYLTPTLQVQGTKMSTLMMMAVTRRTWTW